jgi:hypothetical protein
MALRHATGAELFEGRCWCCPEVHCGEHGGIRVADSRQARKLCDFSTAGRGVHGALAHAFGRLHLGQ